MLAEDVVVVAESPHISLEASQTSLDLSGVLLNPHPLESPDDHLEIAIEGVGGDRDDPPLDGVGKQTLACFVSNDGLVVDVLGRDVHQGEVVGPLIRQDVLGRDPVDVLLHGAEELLPRPPGLSLVFDICQATERLERELGIDGNHAVADLDHRIHPFPAPEGVLHGEMSGRQDLCQQLSQEGLSHPSPQLRGLQEILQAGDGLPHLHHLLGGLGQLPQVARETLE